nr:extensin-like [Salvelinus alpinus]
MDPDSPLNTNPGLEDMDLPPNANTHPQTSANPTPALQLTPQPQPAVSNTPTTSPHVSTPPTPQATPAQHPANTKEYPPDPTSPQLTDLIMNHQPITSTTAITRLIHTSPSPTNTPKPSTPTSLSLKQNPQHSANTTQPQLTPSHHPPANTPTPSYHPPINPQTSANTTTTPTTQPPANTPPSSS